MCKDDMVRLFNGIVFSLKGEGTEQLCLHYTSQVARSRETMKKAFCHLTSSQGQGGSGDVHSAGFFLPACFAVLSGLPSAGLVQKGGLKQPLSGASFSVASPGSPCISRSRLLA